jgi:hypothetical protein
MRVSVVLAGAAAALSISASANAAGVRADDAEIRNGWNAARTCFEEVGEELAHCATTLITEHGGESDKFLMGLTLGLWDDWNNGMAMVLIRNGVDADVSGYDLGARTSFKAMMKYKTRLGLTKKDLIDTYITNREYAFKIWDADALEISDDGN